MNTGFLGIGVSLPETILDSFEIEKKLGKEKGWIFRRTGIKQRRIISDDKQVSDLGKEAALRAIKNAGIRKEDIDYILVATSSPEMIWPSTACIIQEKLKLLNVPCVDIQAVCSGFSYGLDLANAKIEKNPEMKILFICTEAFTRMVDKEDQVTYPLFGDGAGAVVLGKVENSYGILRNYLGADGRMTNLLKIPAGGSANPCNRPKSHKVLMEGTEVFKYVLDLLPKITKDALEKCNLSINDIKYFIPHQANQRITSDFEGKMDLKGSEKVFSNIEKYGNTSCASIMIALNELYESGKLKKGDLVVTIGFGAGFTWGINIIRWNLKPKYKKS